MVQQGLLKLSGSNIWGVTDGPGFYQHRPKRFLLFLLSVSSSALFVSVWACGGGFRFMFCSRSFFLFIVIFPLFVVYFSVLHLLPTANVFVMFFCFIDCSVYFHFFLVNSFISLWIGIVFVFDMITCLIVFYLICMFLKQYLPSVFSIVYSLGSLVRVLLITLFLFLCCVVPQGLFKPNGSECHFTAPQGKPTGLI